MMPQISPVSHTILIAWMNHLHKEKERKDLTESTGVVPAKYPSKVKLELFSQL